LGDESRHWFSTIFGVYVFAGAFGVALASIILMAIAVTGQGWLRGVVTSEHLHDLGKLMFAFVAFWAYIAFSQYFLIWYANIPEETVWYLHRWHGEWRAITLLVAIGHFPVPFFFLLARTIKRKGATLAVGALWMGFIHYIDLYWLLCPPS
jgi:hypothetical protein